MYNIPQNFRRLTRTIIFEYLCTILDGVRAPTVDDIPDITDWSIEIVDNEHRY
jgi:hypothetical protein